jgi:predicted nucleic acid-binding protein
MKPKYLLDISVLLALLWEKHQHHERVTAWMGSGVACAVCPISELGFVRISTQSSFGVTVDEARKMLKDWRTVTNAAFVACDVELLKTAAPSAGSKTTDFYLASLAEKHEMKFATLDEGINHKAAFVVPQ